MLNILANSKGFPGEPKLLLDSFVGCDEAGWIVRSEKVPCVKAGEVLKGAEELVSTDY